METPQQSGTSCDCEPFVYMPAWWSSFLFQVFSPRQLSVYYYIAMLGVTDGVSRPTIKQIQNDMGLASDSMVYESLRALEDGALIRRVRMRNDGGAAQNGYRRPSCESTLIRLLEKEVIDSRLRPTGVAQSADVTDLAREGLETLLGNAFSEYLAATPDKRGDVLIQLLQSSRDRRVRAPDKQCACALEEGVAAR